MGYYAPSFANLASGWYWTTSNEPYANERDKCLEKWNDKCDLIVAKYLNKYGMFLSAFTKDIKEEIRELVDAPFPFPAYFSYFVVSKVLFDPNLNGVYTTDYNTRARTIITCEICAREQYYDDIHPSLIGRTKKILPLCNSCWFMLSEFTNLSTLSEIPIDFKLWFSKLKQEQICAICNQRYTWIKEIVPKMYGAYFIPGKHLHICPKCVQKAMMGNKNSDDLESNLKTFKIIADQLGVVPNRTGFIYNQVDDPELAINTTKEMHKMRSFDDLSQECGSWFKLLIASGVLPKGSRKTKYGTMVLAKDGHECLSLAEKEIDDLLFATGIEHEREPHYPNSNFKADWLLNTGNEKIFVELFGLYGETQYNKRMKEKLNYAIANGIKVISFLPKDLDDLNHSFSVKVLTLFPEKAKAPNFL